MKQFNSMLSQELTWSLSKNKLSLKSGDDVVVVVKEKKSGKASFELDHADYVIRNEGFWNPTTVVGKDGEQVLVLRRPFVGNKGLITFNSGKTYSCKVRDVFPIRLACFNAAGKEVLNYSLDASLKSRLKFKIADQSIDKYELIMLIIVGCFCFRGISKELHVVPEMPAAAAQT